VEVGENCPDCGKPLVERRSRFGTFVGCSGYPECRFIKRAGGEAAAPPPEPTGVACPRCAKGSLLKRVASKGRNKGNTFYGCSNYPRCRFITNDLTNLEDTKAPVKVKKDVAEAVAKATPVRKTAPPARKATVEVTAAPVADGTVSGGRVSRAKRGASSRSTRNGASEAVWAAAIAAEEG
ncbi:MAG TPA: topoisomerase DNA-binding C4 zinc finger domain-containing protein, partial [Chloroflexota bacterium]|jgi:DNA topoisomerase-1